MSDIEKVIKNDSDYVNQDVVDQDVVDQDVADQNVVDQDDVDQDVADQDDVDQEDMTLKIGEVEDNFVENSLHLAEILPLFFFEMFNEYMIYYKNVNREAENTNLFDGVDIKNKMSTNKQLEYFYEAKFKF